MSDNFKLNFPIETPEAWKLWGSKHRLNRIKAIIAFSLDLDNANDNLRRHGYANLYRKKYLKIYKGFVNNPSCKGIPFSTLDDLWYNPKTPTTTGTAVNVSVSLADLNLSFTGNNGLGVVSWSNINGVDVSVSPASLLNNGDSVTITLTAQTGYSVNGKSTDTITYTVPSDAFALFRIVTDFPPTSDPNTPLTVTWENGIGPYEVTLLDHASNVIINPVSVPDGTETYTFSTQGLPSGIYHANVKDSSFIKQDDNTSGTVFSTGKPLYVINSVNATNQLTELPVGVGVDPMFTLDVENMELNKPLSFTILPANTKIKTIRH